MVHSTSTCTAAALLLFTSGVSAWTPTAALHRNCVAPSKTTALLSTPDPKDPCWQDNYDSEDDCLSTTYSAAFVAEEWIKSMPCGKGADCLPEKLSHPGTMGDAVRSVHSFVLCTLSWTKKSNQYLLTVSIQREWRRLMS